ncbi:M48 family metallopeptidase [Halobacterium sp. MBLA0001]|uniref:M48 family metallopeptidase n=1 Tax=Halobacterium TaxID=2239 RepID=UPI0025565259|nr:M48 family metallopeptidase [Halobacterium salinarum]MDL0135593.1 M48 family metallopeptidase [Halobacterium salinarum]
MLVHHVVFLALVAGTTLLFASLAALNVRYAERTVRERNAWLATHIGVDDPGELLAYHRLGTAVSQLRSVVLAGAVLGVLYTGAFGAAVAFVYDTVGSDVLAGVALLVGATVAMQVARVPFDAVETFGVESAFGFNEQSPALFARDALLSAGLAGVFVAVLGGAVLVAVAALPEWWFVAATGIVGVFLLATQVLVPRVVMPLFYDFDPVDEGGLRDAIEDVFDRAGFACEQVYVMNASSRSGHSNAFFTGFGATKRVVLFDTLIDQMGETELQAVLAHELAHWKNGHIWQTIGAATLQAGVVLFVASRLLDAGWLYGMFGVPEQPAAGLLLAGVWLQPLSRLTAPLQNKLWLANEREADAFAVDVMGDGEPLADALGALTSQNLGNPFPHPYYEAFHYQHPPVPERIRYLTAADSGAAAERSACRERNR